MTKRRPARAGMEPSARAYNSAGNLSGGGIRFVPHGREPSSAAAEERDLFGPTVSVVICTRNRPAELRSCLEAVTKLSPAADEVIVVDNSSGDKQAELLAESFGARYVLECIPGLSRARNRGLAESRCEFVAYLDDDSVPSRDWLQFLLAPFEDERVAAVTGGITKSAPCGTQPEKTPRGIEEIRYLSRDAPKWFEIASFGGLGIGCNMAFRKCCCSGPEFFDERLGRGTPLRIGEENCAFASLLSQEYAVVHLPAARVYHPEKPWDVVLESACTIAYWLLLYERFPANRFDLLGFLLRRIMKKRPSWKLEEEESDGIVSSSRRAQMKAFLVGIELFWRAKNGKVEMPPKDSNRPALALSRGRSRGHSTALS